MTLASRSKSVEPLRALPGDRARQIMWRFADRDDVQQLLRAVRDVARGPVARLVSGGARRSAGWTAEKGVLVDAFDRAGVTMRSADRADGGPVSGPKSLAMALVGLELAWVDAGAGGRPPLRGAFCLTEPLPSVGVETGLLGGAVRVAEWREGEELALPVDKRGRFITNMAFADFVVVAVGSADPRIKGSGMVIVESGDPGTFDRGPATPALVHQLSPTHDPVFSLRVLASRIVGGYDVVDGVIVPRSSHGDVAETVFRRTRVTVGAITAAKLLSAVEPVLRYQRGRFRGAASVSPGTRRHQMGLHLREDALHRLIDVWATGEAAALLAAVLGSASQLWNTGHGATMMREAVSLMGSYGIIEDCPGFLGQKAMDAQLEAIYEGPESVHRRTLSTTMADEVFLAQFRAWSAVIRHVAALRPASPASRTSSTSGTDWTAA